MQSKTSGVSDLFDKKSKSEFDEGFLTEEEVSLVKRMLPSDYSIFIHNSKRKDLLIRLSHDKRISQSTSSLIARTLRKLAFGLSKRSAIKNVVNNNKSSVLSMRTLSP